MSSTTRQPKGVTSGGQFAPTAHADPSIQLQRLTELEDVFAFTPGTRVMTGNEFGRISETGKDRNGNVIVNLDNGGSLHLKASRVVPWEAYLDTVMPAAEHEPLPYADEVPQANADWVLRTSLVRMRNATDSSAQAATPYYDGIAAGEAEVAAALTDADSDPETIQNRRNAFLGLDEDELKSARILERTSASLSTVRARRLARYFTARAVEMHEGLSDKSSKDWKDADWIKNGAKFAFSNAAVRFANGAAQGDNRHHEERFAKLLLEGETNINTIIGETFDEEAW